MIEKNMELKWCQIFTPFFSQISWKKNMNPSFCPLPTYEEINPIIKEKSPNKCIL